MPYDLKTPCRRDVRPRGHVKKGPGVGKVHSRTDALHPVLKSPVVVDRAVKGHHLETRVAVVEQVLPKRLVGLGVHRRVQRLELVHGTGD